MLCNIYGKKLKYYVVVERHLNSGRHVVVEGTQRLNACVTKICANDDTHDMHARVAPGARNQVVRAAGLSTTLGTDGAVGEDVSYPRVFVETALSIWS